MQEDEEAIKKNSLLAQYPSGSALTFSLFLWYVLICCPFLRWECRAFSSFLQLFDRRDIVIKMQTIEYFIVQFKAELLKCCKIVPIVHEISPQIEKTALIFWYFFAPVHYQRNRTRISFIKFMSIFDLNKSPPNVNLAKYEVLFKKNWLLYDAYKQFFFCGKWNFKLFIKNHATEVKTSRAAVAQYSWFASK